LSIIERREPNELHACRTCGTDITAELDASYEYGYRRGYEKRASYEPQLEGAVSALTEAAASLNDAGRRFAQLEQQNMALLMTEAADRARAALGGQ
jgi:hypothetical protein